MTNPKKRRLKDSQRALNLSDEKVIYALQNFDKEESKVIVLEALEFYSKFVRPRAGKDSKYPGYLAYWEKLDIAHDVYLSFLNNGINYDPEKGSPAQFLVGTMKNAAVAYVKRKYVFNTSSGEDELPVSLFSDDADDEERASLFPDYVEYPFEDDEDEDEESKEQILHPVLIAFLDFIRNELLLKLASTVERGGSIIQRDCLKFIISYIERMPEDEEVTHTFRQIFLQPEIRENILSKRTKKRVKLILEKIRDSLIQLFLEENALKVEDIPDKDLNRIKSTLRNALNIARENLDNLFEQTG